MTDKLRNRLVASGVAVDEALRRFGGNAALMLKYLRVFPQDPSMAALRQAVTANDREEMEACAHTLRGTSGTLGLKALYDAACALTARLREDAPADIGALYAAVERAHGEMTRALTETNWEG